MKKLLLIGITVIFLTATIIGMGFTKRIAINPTADQPTVTPATEFVQMFPAADAGTIRTEFLDAVCRYEPGTAGSSLKRAVAAMHVLEFCNTHHLADTDREQFTKNLLTAWKEFPETEKKFFPELFASISEQVDEDLQNGASLSGLFEDAGILEEMQQLLQEENLQSSWKMLKECTEVLE